MLIACTSILSLFSSHLCFDQFIFTLCSLPYVHFLLSGSVFLPGFRMILDFFTAFLGFMSIFLVAFTLVSVFLSGFRMILDFFTAFSRLYVHFHLLGSVFPSSFRMILDFFTAFSVLYVHFLLPGSVFPSSFRMILDFFPIFLSFMSIWKSTEVSGLRNAALRRIKRSAITPFLFQKLLSRLP